MLSFVVDFDDLILDDVLNSEDRQSRAAQVVTQRNANRLSVRAVAVFDEARQIAGFSRIDAVGFAEVFDEREERQVGSEGGIACHELSDHLVDHQSWH